MSLQGIPYEQHQPGKGDSLDQIETNHCCSHFPLLGSRFSFTLTFHSAFAGMFVVKTRTWASPRAVHHWTARSALCCGSLATRPWQERKRAQRSESENYRASSTHLDLNVSTHDRVLIGTRPPFHVDDVQPRFHAVERQSRLEAVTT